MPDDHSKLVPLLPIPNRTVKRLCADDSAGSRVKVGHRQALTAQNAQPSCDGWAFFPKLPPRRSFSTVPRQMDTVEKQKIVDRFKNNVS